ncbi:MAG: hypothetical protein P8J32_05045 [bacterium]|jgi:hypothetical protein|nr:hypothetical protein [bacterium]
MFEDETQQPEDMFEATDKVAPQVTPPTDAAAPAPAPMQQAPSQAPQPAAAPTSATPPQMEEISGRSGGGGIKIALLVVGIIVIIGAAFLLSMRILGSRTPATPDAPIVDSEDVEEAMVVQEQEEPVQEVEEEVEEEVEAEEEPVDAQDTDKDGLTDAEEEALGTSPLSEDTDGDGLFDHEEVMTWETNPLNPDTDGDGYDDGSEVDAGYNPNGEGELRQIPDTKN